MNNSNFRCDNEHCRIKADPAQFKWYCGSSPIINNSSAEVKIWCSECIRIARLSGNECVCAWCSEVMCNKPYEFGGGFMCYRCLITTDVSTFPSPEGYIDVFSLMKHATSCGDDGDKCKTCVSILQYVDSRNRDREERGKICSMVTEERKRKMPAQCELAVTLLIPGLGRDAVLEVCKRAKFERVPKTSKEVVIMLINKRQ